MNNEPVELHFFSDAIIRRWYLPLGLAIIGGLIGFQLRPETGPTLYEAESRLLIRPVTDSVFDSNLRVDQIINADTEAQLAGSETVAHDALELLGPESPAALTVDDVTENLTVKVRTDSQIVVIRYRHADADVAGAVTDAVATAYLNSRSEAAIQEKARQADQLASQVSELTRDLTTANVTIAIGEAEGAARAALETRIARLEEVVAIEALRGDESEAVGDPIGALRLELDSLEQTVNAVSIAAAITTVELTTGQIANLRDELIELLTLEIDGGDTIQQAGLGEPIPPANEFLYPAIGALLGLLVGVVMAVLVERSVASRAVGTVAHLGSATPPDRLFVVAGAQTNPNPQAATQVSSLSGTGRTEATAVPSPGPSGPVWSAGVDATAKALVHEPAPTPEPTLRSVSEPLVDPEVEAPVMATTPAPEPPPAPVAATIDPGPPPPPTLATSNSVASLADVAKIPRSAQEPVAVTDPKSEPAIALRRVARVIHNETRALDTPAILIASAKPHEGRTTVATNLAAVLRQAGRSVLLVTDAYDRVIAPGVHILPPGMRLGPDLEFPETDRLRELLVEARDLVDIVIIDGPSVLDSDEALKLAAAADRAILVAVTARTSAADVAAAKQRLESTGIGVMGLVTTARPSWLVRRIGDRTMPASPVTGASSGDISTHADPPDIL